MTTTSNYYGLKESTSNFKVIKIQNPSFTDGFCQFTGGGCILIATGKITLLIYHRPVETEESISPNKDKESIVSLTIVGKNKLQQ